MFVTNNIHVLYFRRTTGTISLKEKLYNAASTKTLAMQRDLSIHRLTRVQAKSSSFYKFHGLTLMYESDGYSVVVLEEPLFLSRKLVCVCVLRERERDNHIK